MQVLATQDQLRADALRADKWPFRSKEEFLWIGGLHSPVQHQGQLPQPKLFTNTGSSCQQERVQFGYKALRHLNEDSAFANLKSLAVRVNQTCSAEPVVHSPDSQAGLGAHSSPNASPGNIERPLEAVSSPELFNGAENKDAVLSSMVLRAMEGSLSACAHLNKGHIRAEGIRPLALHRCLLPMLEAGVLRARLQQFVRHHDTLVYQGSPVDATQAAFARGVRMVLELHLVLLRTCMTSILARRAAEAPEADSDMHSNHPTVLELMQHTRPIREQVKFLGDLCWCHVDEKREFVENERVPMKWETAPFPKFAELLDHVHSELAVCTSTNAHMCRFLMTECMQPLLSQLFHWTHSADGTHTTCLSMLMRSATPAGLNFHRPSAGLEQWPAQIMQLQLPRFLRSMHDVILLTGLQMRYLASLQQCINTVPVLARSAQRQLQQVKSVVALCEHEPSSALDSFAPPVDFGASESCTWTTTIGWQWETVQSARKVAQAGASERQAASDLMLWNLEEVRRAAGDALSAERTAILQQRQQEATAREQQQAQAAHEANMQRAALLQQRLLEIDTRQKQRLALEQDRQQEERIGLHGWMWDGSIGDSMRLAAEVKQLLVHDTSIEQREARMEWRLKRWELQHERQQLLQKTKQEEHAMMAHHQRKSAQQAMLGVSSSQKQGIQTASSVAGSAHSSHLSLPRTFRLQSRSRGSRQAFTRKNSRGSLALLEPLNEETGSMYSAATTRSHGMLSDRQSRLLALSQAGSHVLEHSTASLASASIHEEPQLHAAPDSIFAGSSSRASSQAASMSRGVLSARNLIEPDEAFARASFFGASSSAASISDVGPSQFDNPFLGGAWSRLGATESANSMVSGSVGTVQDHPVLGSMSGGAQDAYSSLSYAPSTSHRDSQGGQSTVASAASTSSLRKQWIPVQATAAPSGAADAAEQTDSDRNIGLGYVPVSVALAVFVHEPLYAQYHLTSRACMAVARDELQLLQVAEVLQDVLLGGRTTVVNCVVESIKHQLRAHQEVRAGHLHSSFQEAAADVLSAHDTPGAGVVQGLEFGVVLNPSRQVTAASVKQDRCIDSDDDLPAVPGNDRQNDAGTLAEETTPTVSGKDFDLQSLDAVQITCSMPAVLQMLIPASALKFYADVFSVLLRTRWATSHLQRVLLLLHKALRHQPALRHSLESSIVAAHRLRLLSLTLQAAQHTASQFERHLYMGILEPACIRFRRKLRSDMDMRQCATSFVNFGAECALECLLASDAQLPVVVANMLSLCQHASSLVGQLLLHVAVEDMDLCEAASFGDLAIRVLDEEVWEQLHSMMTNLETRAQFIKDRLHVLV